MTQVRLGIGLALAAAVVVVATVSGSRWHQQRAQQEAEAARQSIEQVFVAYRDASAADDGFAAAALLSDGSRAYFDDIYEETLHADERRLDRLDPVRRLLVLSLRAIATQKELDLRQLTPGELTALAFEWKIIGQELSPEHGFYGATVQGDDAAVQLRVREQALERREWFERDEDGWRYNILPVLADWGLSLEERARELGVEPALVADMTVQGFLHTLLEPALYEPWTTPGDTGPN